MQAVRRCIAAAKPSVSDKRAVLVSRRASDITPEPITWLWPGHIARGKVTLIAGMPGLGKSQITAYLAATISIGGMLPADGGKSPLGSVIFLSAEDDPADTIVPRLMAAGADRTRIEIVEAVSEPAPGQPGIRRPVSLKSDLALLSEVIARLGDTALVIVDPISAYLGNVDSHKNAEVRALLAPLTDWAAQRQVAVVGVTHLNKGGGDALSRFTGSMAFVAAARGGFLVVPDAEDETGERRLFLPAKNNIAKKLPGLAFTVLGVTLPNEIETSRIEWCPGEVNVSADQALYGANDSDETHASGAIAEAVDWLREVLQGAPEGGTPGRPKDGKWVKEQARASGIAERTLDRAAQKLGVVKHSNGFGKSRLWAMPSTPSAPSASMCARQPGLAHMDNVGAHGSPFDPPNSVKHSSNNNFGSAEGGGGDRSAPDETGEDF